MKILQILPELNVGGVETGTVDFSKYLVQHGHQSLVVSNGGKLVAELEQSGTKHYTLPVHKKSLLTMIRMVAPLRKIIQEEGVNIVHARSRVPAWIAYFACRKTNAAFITTCHGHYNNRFYSQVMGWSKLVIVPSTMIGRYMTETYKVPAKNIRCVPRGVDLAKFKHLEGKAKVSKVPASGLLDNSRKQCTIAIIGRITPLKGHTYFIRAMAKVVQSVPLAKIWIIGDVPPKKIAYKQELESLVRRCGLQNHVEFLGSRQDIPELLKQIDVLVLSSVTPESFGRVILEAQVLNVPVVATKVGGVVDIIDDEQTGFLVLPKDTEAMGKAVVRLLQGRALADRLAKAARQKLEAQFTLEHMAEKVMSVYEELLKSVNILVIKISSVGDVILVTPSLRALRKKFPKAKMCCLVGKNVRRILQGCPYVDELIMYDPQHKDKGFFKFWQFAHRLRRYCFDKVIDFQNSRKSHWLSFLSFPKDSYGYNNGKDGFLLSHTVKKSKQELMKLAPVQHQFQVLNLLGISYDNKDAYLQLWPSAKDEEYVEALLDAEWLGDNHNMVGINMAASPKWKTKNWPLEYIAQLCDLLAGKGMRVIITGMDKDKPMAQHLVQRTKSKPAIFVGETDLLQLAALIKKCSVFITPDSAPMHVAAAVGTPCITFFGPTDSRRHIPPAKNLIVLERQLTCTPCYKQRCKILTHACMQDIKPEEVLGAVEEIMESEKKNY